MMRCEDCAPFIEEYFDGEVDITVGERMSAHISACADCAAALDALSFEGEIYAQYERGLEPTPALWARVSAGIAREPQTETPPERRPFLSRTLESIAAAFGALSLRPALASSLALLVVGITAGSLWLAYRPTSTNSPLIATTAETKETPAPASSPVVAPPPKGAEVDPVGAGAEIALGEKTVRTAAARVPGANDKENNPVPVEELLRESSSPTQPVSPPHQTGDDEIAGLINAPKVDAGLVDASAQSPDVGEKEMARHVEQTQMLLRSIKNAHASDDGNMVNIAYEKSLSRQLLADNATLKLEADVKGDKDTKQVLDTIEPFLLDIANMREQPSREEVRSIRERVKKTEIIASLQVY